MKKIIILSAIVAVGAISGLTIANKKVENKISEAIIQGNSINKDVTAKADVSANVLTGKLKFSNIDIQYYGNHLTEGEVIIDGIKFYDKENMFSDVMNIELNDFIVNQQDMKYISNNEIEIKNNPETGDLTLFTKSEFIDQNDSSYKMIQSLNIKMAKTQDLYTDLTKAFTLKVKDESADLQSIAPVLLNKLSGSTVKNINMGFSNDKMLQRSIRKDLATKFPNVKEEDMDKFIAHQLNNEINKVPELWQEPIKRVILNPSSTLNVDITAKNDITLNYVYMEVLNGKPIQETLMKNYEIVIK